jgi:hypothetical protein
MKILTIVFLWPLLFLTLAYPSAQSQELGPVGFCHTIAESKKQELSFFKRLDLLKELILMRYFPGAFGAPVVKELNLSTQPTIATNSAVKVGANLIFAIGPDPMELQGYKQDEKLQARLDQIEKEIAAASKILSKMFRARTLEKCSRLAREHQFSHEYFISLVNERAQIPWPRQSQELAKLEKKIVSILKKSKQIWEYRRSTRMEEVLSAVSSGRYENIIIISHGQSSGQLVDSSHSTYPVGSFTQIAPQLKSLAFYSCYSNKTLLQYDLEKLMTETPSLHSKRFLVSVKERKQDLAGQVAPLEGFKKFFNNWDKKLRQETGPSRTVVSVELKKCQLQIEGFSLTSGVLSISLNRNLIGVIRPGSRDHSASFECRLLNKEKNLLVIKNEDSNQEARGDFSQIAFPILPSHLNSPAATSAPEAQIYWNPNQSLRSILVRF